jgi:tetratricopeptide (TPR) repeat protein
MENARKDRMRPKTVGFATFVIFCMSSGIWASAAQGTPPSTTTQAAKPSDPLDGRWTGTVKNPQGQEMAIIVFFKKEASGYSGSITDFAPSRPMIPFQEVKFDGQTAVDVKYSFTPPNGQNTSVEIHLVTSGMALQGNANVKVGNGVPIALTYDLKRQNETFDPKVTAPAPQPDMEEFAKIREERDPAAKKQMIDEFGQKYPQSRALPFVYQEGALLGRAGNNIDMMGEYGEKSLAAWPDNYVLMTELGSAYVQRRQVDKAEEKATKALALIVTAAKPTNASEEQWNAAKNLMMATNQCTLGFVHLNRAQVTTDAAIKKNEAEAALAPFQKSLEISPKDDYSLYGIGVSYGLLNNYPNAETNLARASVVNGVVSPMAKSTLETIYKNEHKNSLDGLDKVLAKAKSDLGIPQ